MSEPIEPTSSENNNLTSYPFQSRHDSFTDLGIRAPRFRTANDPAAKSSDDGEAADIAWASIRRCRVEDRGSVAVQAGEGW